MPTLFWGHLLGSAAADAGLDMEGSVPRLRLWRLVSLVVLAALVATSVEWFVSPPPQSMAAAEELQAPPIARPLGGGGM
jgi:hypothetical protein